MKYNVNMQTTKDEICWLFDSEIECLQIWYLVKHIREKKINGIIDLYMPYCPEARMDRFQHNDEIFTLKYFSNLLNSLNFHSVKIFDPHSHVCEALIDRVEIETPKNQLEKISYKYPNAIYAFPDAGSAKRYNKFISMPAIFGIKNRKEEK